MIIQYNSGDGPKERCITLFSCDYFDEYIKDTYIIHMVNKCSSSLFESECLEGEIKSIIVVV